MDSPHNLKIPTPDRILSVGDLRFYGRLHHASPSNVGIKMGCFSRAAARSKQPDLLPQGYLPLGIIL